MSEHTPGPWIPGRSDMATIVGGVKSKWIYSGDMYVAIASGLASEDWDEVMANARLIAAAPELLDFVRAFVAWDENPSTKAEAAKLRSMAAAAIAKATGGTS